MAETGGKGMSVLIKGIEMPTNCEKCPFLDYEEGFCFASGVKGKSGWYESKLCPGGIKDGRHDECPLVPVPEHGRLIDADALMEQVERDTPLSAVYEKTMRRYLNTAPTIIPADKEKKELENG